MPKLPYIYCLEVGYSLKVTDQRSLEKLIKRKAMLQSGLSLYVGKPQNAVTFSFKQPKAFNKAVARLRESGLNIRFLASKQDSDYQVTPLPALSNCRKL